MFVHSISDGHLDFFLQSMTQWMLALDHVPYARWLSVFTEDVKLSENDEVNVKAIFHGFSKGFFTVAKMSNPLSSISIDQTHK